MLNIYATYGRNFLKTNTKESLQAYQRKLKYERKPLEKRIAAVKIFLLS